VTRLDWDAELPDGWYPLGDPMVGFDQWAVMIPDFCPQCGTYSAFFTSREDQDPPSRPSGLPDDAQAFATFSVHCGSARCEWWSSYTVWMQK
jgi:hypothetical protein